MLLVLLSAVCAVVLSGVLRSDAALWRRRVFREMARLPFPGRCWKSGGLLCCGRLLVAEVARCSGLLVAAGCSLQQVACCSGFPCCSRLLVAEVACCGRCAICCQPPVAAGVRPSAVRTTAQPYTADRPTPPRPQNNRSQFTCRLRARRALGGVPRSACAVPSAFGFYCQKLVACQPDVPVPGCPGGCRICNLFRLICNLRLSRRWRTLNFRDIHLRA